MKKHEGSIKNPEQFLRGTIMLDMLQKPASHYGDDTAKPGLDWYLDRMENIQNYILKNKKTRKRTRK